MVSHLHEAILTSFYGWVGCFIGIRRFRRRVTYSASGNNWRRTLDCTLLNVSLGKSPRLIPGNSRRQWQKPDEVDIMDLPQEPVYRGLLALLQDRNIPTGSCELSLHAFPFKSHGTSFVPVKCQDRVEWNMRFLPNFQFFQTRLGN